ncbi:MAG: thiopurine S-methyltransferase [Methylococcales bacterium]
MSEKFWHQQWESNLIEFHKENVNPLLVSYFKDLDIDKASCVFLPLCGKTLDISWLLSNSYRVVGVDLSELAIKQLFAELGVRPEITDIGEIKHYSAKDIDIFVGDIFALTRDMLRSVDAVFDRGGLVALPKDIRGRYTKHVANITDNAPHLLISYEYNQDLMEGPPFSISDEEIDRHYKDRYKISLLTSEKVTGKLSEACEIKENVWLLQTLKT